MKKITILFVLMLTASVCFADVGEEAAAPAAPAKADEGAVGTTELYTGQNVVIKLKSNKTTGYSWELADPVDPEMLEFVSSEYMVPETPMAGAGGEEIWTFTALKAGEAQISFRYIRPWEKGIPASQKATFIVKIKEAPAGGKASSVRPVAPNMVTGTVESIEFADLWRKPNPTLVITDERGERVSFEVKPSAPVYGDSGSFFTLRQVSPGDRISVNYRKGRTGVNEAAVIRVMGK
ncbi:MAG: protease inhibitor I42 family protein [Candidatus Omnitrophica bacterium]|nr:protease inhibitor I42 family protein [Candidatus Omnitrophota bacterium]